MVGVSLPEKRDRAYHGTETARAVPYKSFEKRLKTAASSFPRKIYGQSRKIFLRNILKISSSDEDFLSVALRLRPLFKKFDLGFDGFVKIRDEKTFIFAMS